MIGLRLFAVLLLTGLNAFFVAAEFSLVAMRASRVRQLIEEGHSAARVVQWLQADLDRVLSGVQLGITFASLGLGYVGQTTFAALFQNALSWMPSTQALLVANTAAVVLAFSLITFLHVVLGELVPKSLALQTTERLALLVARPLHWFITVFRWPIDAFDGAARVMVRWMGVANPHSHSLVHSPEELLVLVEQARERGLVQAREQRFIESALELSRIQVREIMVPRPDLHVLPVEASLEETLRVFATTQRSRLPVYQGTLDHILGFVHIKDIFWILLDRERRMEEGAAPPPFNLRRILRDVLIVPEGKPVSELLLEMRTRRMGLAMVVDEHGSILGMVTLEDILEEIVGEIHDEFDVPEQPARLADGALIFDGSTKLRDLETQYEIDLPDDPAYETIGGFVLAQLGFIPRGGETFDWDGLRFTVLEMDRRRVARVKIQQLKTDAGAADPSAGKTPS
jgi:CBS domain containing-hemolysin-like protein